MNMKQLAKLMAAGVLSMATIPAISLAHTHHHVQAIAPSLSATTITPATSTTIKHTRLSKLSHKQRTSLAMRRKSHLALSHRKTAHTSLSKRTSRHSALSRRTSSHTALSHLSRKSTKLSTKKTAL